MGTIKFEELVLKGEDLKDFLYKNKISLLELSKIVGIGQSTLSQIQNGYRSISNKNKERLLSGLPKLVEYLINKKNSTLGENTLNTYELGNFDKDILKLEKPNKVDVGTIPTRELLNKESLSDNLIINKERDIVNDLCKLVKTLTLKGTPLTEEEYTVKMYLHNKYNVNDNNNFFTDDQLNVIVEEILYLVKKLA